MTPRKAALDSRSDDVKKILASKQRAETRHDPRQRQLSALAGVLLLALSVFGAPAERPRLPTAQEELRAARMMEAALIARQASEEEWRKMERIYVNLAAKYPGDAAIPNAHAELLWNLGQQPLAVDKWLVAERLDPNNTTVLDHLGGSFLAAGEVKKAAAYYRRAAANPQAEANHHYNYANVAFLFRHELLDAAHPDADSVLREALSHFGQAARLEPFDPEYARAFAETYYTVHPSDWPAALRAWQHFYEISPQKDFALVNIARIQMKLGQKSDARRTLGRVQNPEFDRLKSRLTERVDTE